MNEKILSYIKKYLISFVIMGISTLFILNLRGVFADNVTDIFRHLADSFTIPGVIMLMVGVMVWISTTGSFDMLNYGLLKAKNSLIPSTQYTHETFYDYKSRKDGKRIKNYSFLFISGGIYMIPALVFNILYYTV